MRETPHPQHLRLDPEGQQSKRLFPELREDIEELLSLHSAPSTSAEQGLSRISAADGSWSPTEPLLLQVLSHDILLCFLSTFKF